MLPDMTLPLPASLASLLAVFGPLFTAPSFRTFCGLACGFLAQAGRRTVCGMLAGAGLARAWPHDRAHWFFSRARWSADNLGLAAAKLVVALLVPAGAQPDSGPRTAYGERTPFTSSSTNKSTTARGMASVLGESGGRPDGKHRRVCTGTMGSWSMAA